jgi:hypothetical protein
VSTNTISAGLSARPLLLLLLLVLALLLLLLLLLFFRLLLRLALSSIAATPSRMGTTLPSTTAGGGVGRSKEQKNKSK